MTPPYEPDEGRALDSALRRWVVEAPLPPRFQEQVWQRIARAEASRPVGVWAWLAGLVETTLPRPRVAVSFIAALLLVGVATGSLTAQVKNTELNATLGNRYVQSIDPYLAERAQR